MPEGEPKRVVKKVSTALVRVSESPLDSTGFFKNGKIHDNIHKDLTCGCLNCQGLAVKEVLKAGVFKEAEVEMVLDRYRIVAVKIHQVRRS